MEPTPAAEFEVTEPLVRSLLQQQCPELAELPIRSFEHGWDNEIFRLGNDFTLRFPRRASAAELVTFEQKWLPAIAPSLPLPVPVPVFVGMPGDGYPWSWSVNPWLPGSSAVSTKYNEIQVADDLASFLSALHIPAPADLPLNPVRGIPLREREPLARPRIDQLEGVDHSLLHLLWSELSATPDFPGEPVLCHGDFHPGNILVRNGCVSAVIDFGDITAGDPAVDHACAWMFFGPAGRARFLGTLNVSGEARERARGWALALGIAVASTSADNPDMAALGYRTIAAVLAND